MNVYFRWFVRCSLTLPSTIAYCLASNSKFVWTHNLTQCRCGSLFALDAIRCQQNCMRLPIWNGVSFTTAQVLYTHGSFALFELIFHIIFHWVSHCRVCSMPSIHMTFMRSIEFMMHIMFFARLFPGCELRTRWKRRLAVYWAVLFHIRLFYDSQAVIMIAVDASADGEIFE